ncbi:hypothetical protein L1987_09673 [Smallanthus sonchifolius]|uniref:Uncharacterized protein n=1 Tax=Smallanthus sonchifolius TaxID=185202 RepID=A0ACB9JQ42_9ASTR|nr:hypothetical protein L1987_09673 [Smallanthus sonchifolius]
MAALGKLGPFRAMAANCSVMFKRILGKPKQEANAVTTIEKLNEEFGCDSIDVLLNVGDRDRIHKSGLHYRLWSCKKV